LAAIVLGLCCRCFLCFSMLLPCAVALVCSPIFGVTLTVAPFCLPQPPPTWVKGKATTRTLTMQTLPRSSGKGSIREARTCRSRSFVGEPSDPLQQQCTCPGISRPFSGMSQVQQMPHSCFVALPTIAINAAVRDTPVLHSSTPPASLSELHQMITRLV
jgi:hypothetical protein